ncbi:uncharacterized protein DUF2637 [Krasilnikovia cinnamomea]|uniref:Uncharacterized protein DUF2637 n=1 Tax=Krasilnikovia cinnamomea TaxID=349313 RepID=A0A4Q7ZK47_9ACTN|nr:DUF2637 domain-containing protein [Krasilnikovia cinnamomea]RZU51290.1 uncharacterized protein DUF2637 [Krasilnikovia cinnamomea]
MTATMLNGTRPAHHADVPQQPPAVPAAAVAVPAQAVRRQGVRDETKRWGRLRWAVRVALVVGVAASVAANMLHALPNPISQAIAAWPPLALLLTVELISRVPVYRRSLAAVRLLATTVIAGIAAWVSYWHMTAVAARYGETGASPYLLPLSVDGLIVVASICLVELSGRIETADHNPPAAHELGPITPPQPTDAPPAPPTASLPMEPTAAAAASDIPRPAAPEPRIGRNAAAHSDLSPADTAGQAARTALPNQAGESTKGGDTTTPEVAGAPPAEGPPAGGGITADGGSDIPADGPGGPADPPPHEDADRDVVPTDTAAAVAYWLRRDPTMHPDDIAARVGRSSRQVRRYMAPVAPGDRRRVNGERRRLPTDT